MYTKVSIQGNVIEVTRLLRPPNSEPTILKLDADHYKLLSNGKVYEFAHIENRAESSRSLQRTFKTIRALVNTNFTGNDSEKFITLTYAENMRDVERLYRDFKAFWKRFTRKYGKAEYLSVVEPQMRGAWHMHLCVKFQGKAPFVPNAELFECWGHGFVKVTKINNVDNIGAYLSAYLADVEVPLDHGCGVVKEQSDGTKKKFVKGARLSLYPPGMNIYRCSRGIKRPTERWVSEEECATLIDGMKPTYANRREILLEEGQTQTIIKEYYNVKRRKEPVKEVLCDETSENDSKRPVLSAEHSGIRPPGSDSRQSAVPGSASHAKGRQALSSGQRMTLNQGSERYAEQHRGTAQGCGNDSRTSSGLSEGHQAEILQFRDRQGRTEHKAS